MSMDPRPARVEHGWEEAVQIVDAVHVAADAVGRERAGAAPGAAAEEGHERIDYGAFGRHWVRRVLHVERILRTVDAVLGEEIALGPIGAGPGRSLASVSFVGRYGATTGHELPGDRLTYAVDLPIKVTVALDLPLDRLIFHADVVVPLVLVVHTEAPVRLWLEILTPAEDEIGLELRTDTRRGAVLRRIAGLDAEMRRFLLKVLDTELTKDYVQRATRLDMEQLIDGAWPALSAQFLPRGSADRA